MSKAEKPSIFIGNLRNDRRITKLKQSLGDLLTLHGVPTNVSSIQIIQKKFNVFAFVHYTSQNDRERALQTLSAIVAGPYDVYRHIVRPRKKLRFSDKLGEDNSHINSDELANVDNDGENGTDCNNAQNVLPPQSSLTSQLQNYDRNRGGLAARHAYSMISSGDDAYQHTQLSQDTNEHSIWLANEATNSLTSNPQVAPLQELTAEASPLLADKHEYILGNQLGSETRKLEFKVGGFCKSTEGRKKLVEDVAKYLCAFLNSKGGTLLIGVDDNGIVNGIHIDRKTEDELRCRIDGVIRRIVPAVFGYMYEISFEPVTDSTGRPCGDLKIIEVAVKDIKIKRLYQTPDCKVYMRRDGSLQTLTPSDIQEWIQMSVEEEPVERDTKPQLLRDKEIAMAIDIKRYDEELLSMQENEKNLMSKIEAQRVKQEQLQNDIKRSDEECLSMQENEKNLMSKIEAQQMKQKQLQNVIKRHDEELFSMQEKEKNLMSKIEAQRVKQRQLQNELQLKRRSIFVCYLFKMVMLLWIIALYLL